MSASDPSATNWFVITGFPKSGNKWLSSMVFRCPGVGGRHPDIHRGLPLMAAEVLERSPTLVALLDREGIALEDFVKKLYHPTAPVTLRFSPAGEEALRPILQGFATKASRGVRGVMARDHLDYVVGGPPPRLWEAPRACGAPGLHVPIDVIRTSLPSFRIVNLIRDPRDVVVSLFYHSMATLRPELVVDFVRVGRRRLVPRRDHRWKRRFAARYLRRLQTFQGRAPAVPGDDMLTVRYEDLLARGPEEMMRLLDFVGAPASRGAVEEVVLARSFRTLTGGTQERRNSMTRKGQAGDWRNYFDRALGRALGPRFRGLVRELGYETDDAWYDALPNTAPRAFEFSRFRLQRSTCRRFIGYWEASKQLQARYPNPWAAANGQESYFDWLHACEHRDVQEWLALGRRLQALWKVDIEEHA